MKQLSLFDTQDTHQSSINYWKLYIDGAARNNPGPAGAGICVFKNKIIVAKHHFYLGIKTNNQAEYLALLLGLCSIKDVIQKKDLLHIISDSQLLVRQISGEYKVKEHTLQILHKTTQRLLMNFNYAINHVMREENKEADALANEAIDKKTPIPTKYKVILQNYEITCD